MYELLRFRPLVCGDNLERHKSFHFVSKTVVTNCQRYTVLNNRAWKDCVLSFEDISGIEEMTHRNDVQKVKEQC
jgi:hypothetical protein